MKQINKRKIDFDATNITIIHCTWDKLFITTKIKSKFHIASNSNDESKIFNFQDINCLTTILSLLRFGFSHFVQMFPEKFSNYAITCHRYWILQFFPHKVGIQYLKLRTDIF